MARMISSALLSVTASSSLIPDAGRTDAPPQVVDAALEGAQKGIGGVPGLLVCRAGRPEVAAQT
jgi:hypothetical protein